jgi:hypothetical protein
MLISFLDISSKADDCERVLHTLWIKLHKLQSGKPFGKLSLFGGLFVSKSVELGFVGKELNVAKSKAPQHLYQILFGHRVRQKCGMNFTTDHAARRKA